MGEISQDHYYQFTDMEIKTEVKGLTRSRSNLRKSQAVTSDPIHSFPEQGPKRRGNHFSLPSRVLPFPDRSLRPLVFSPTND